MHYTRVFSPQNIQMNDLLHLVGMNTCEYIKMYYSTYDVHTIFFPQSMQMNDLLHLVGMNTCEDIKMYYSTYDVHTIELSLSCSPPLVWSRCPSIPTYYYGGP